MNILTAKKLLNKKKWTGKEVGKAYIFNLAEQTKAQKENRPFKPIFTRDDLDRMEQNITTQEQFNIFNAYAKLYNGLICSSNLTEAYIQQVYSGFYRYIYTFKDCMQADKVLNAVENYPLIMTRKQYDRINTEIINDRKNFKTSFYETLIEYIEQMLATPEKASIAIKRSIENIKEQPCTNNRILSNYNRDMGNGYYTLPDGTRNDHVSSKIWHKKLKENFLLSHKLKINENEISPEDSFAHYISERLIQLEKIFFEGKDSVRQMLNARRTKNRSNNLFYEMNNIKHVFNIKEGKIGQNDPILDKILKYIEKEIQNIKSIEHYKDKKFAFDKFIDQFQIGATWHIEEDIPKLTKYDIITESTLMERYKGYLADDVELIQQKKEFMQDYPELYEAAVKELKKLLPNTSKIKEENYLQPILTYGQIKEAGLTMYDNYLNVNITDIIDYYCKQDNTANMQKRLRIFYSGIAIIEEDELHQNNITENGDYIENQNNPYLFLESLDSISKDEEKQELLAQYVEYLIKPSIRYIYAYNALIEVLANVYDIDFITVLKKDLSLLVEQIEGFNKLLYEFYFNIFGTVEEKEKKRKLIKNFFKPIYLDEMQPSRKNIRKVKDMLLANYGKSRSCLQLQDLHNIILDIMYERKGAFSWEE